MTKTGGGLGKASLKKWGPLFISATSEASNLYNLGLGSRLPRNNV